MRSTWVTSYGTVVGIDHDFIQMNTNSLSNPYDPNFSLTSTYYGRAALPFFAGVIAGIYNLSVVASVKLILLFGIISIIQGFFRKDIVTYILRSVFSFGTFLTKGWLFFAVQIIISIVNKNARCVVSFIIAMTLLAIIYRIVGAISKKRSMKKYGLTRDNSFDAWDYECLITIYPVATKNGLRRMRFVDFVAYYKYCIQDYVPSTETEEK